jgi:D-beta-D-heptose 7-phosphate kinase/D-beta-D-heptose 1-phosphate adenosyltransferase
MRKPNVARLSKIISRFDESTVLVIGDLILDEFVWGQVSRISPEAPVPVVWVDKENFMPGGASNVASNISSLGGRAILAGTIGADSWGGILKSELMTKGIDVSGAITDAGRPTTLKTRIIAQHQQVARIDRERIEPLAARLSTKLVNYLTKRIDDVQAIVIEDYGKGVVTPRLLNAVIQLAKKKKKIITVDPKEEHFSYYKGVTAITPNQHETASAVGFPIKDDETLKKAGAQLLRQLNCKIALVTRGEQGMCLFQKGKRAISIPTATQDVYDVSGAGDTVISVFTLALSCGASPTEAAHIANCAAGIVVGKLGTATVTAEELKERLRKA